MRSPRPALALDPRLFGRGRTRLLEADAREPWSLPDDAKLFATAFAAGFLFVSILIF